VTLRTALALATLAALAGLSSPSAMADSDVRDASIKVVTTNFDNPPHLVMEHDGGVYRWANKNDNFRINLRLTARTRGVVRLEKGFVLAHYGNGPGRSLWGWPANHRTPKIDQVVPANLGLTEMSIFEAAAKQQCDTHGGAAEVRRGLTMDLRFTVGFNIDVKTVKTTMAVPVICKPKKPAFTVSEVKLYLSPSNPKCNEPVQLTAQFKANMPGSIKFKLVRGDFEMQDVTLNTGANTSLWSKTYTFDETTNRKYMILVTGHPLSTSWVPLEVQCGLVGEAGQAGAFQ